VEDELHYEFVPGVVQGERFSLWRLTASDDLGTPYNGNDSGAYGAGGGSATHGSGTWADRSPRGFGSPPQLRTRLRLGPRSLVSSTEGGPPIGIGHYLSESTPNGSSIARSFLIRKAAPPNDDADAIGRFAASVVGRQVRRPGGNARAGGACQCHAQVKGPVARNRPPSRLQVPLTSSSATWWAGGFRAALTVASLINRRDDSSVDG